MSASRSGKLLTRRVRMEGHTAHANATAGAQAVADSAAGLVMASAAQVPANSSKVVAVTACLQPQPDSTSLLNTHTYRFQNVTPTTLQCHTFGDSKECVAVAEFMSVGGQVSVKVGSQTGAKPATHTVCGTILYVCE